MRSQDIETRLFELQQNRIGAFWPAATEVAVPTHAELRGGEIIYHWATASAEGGVRSEKQIGRRRRVPSALWKRFVSLHKRTDEDIRRFAEEFGPLKPDLKLGEPEKVEYWRERSRLGFAIWRGWDALNSGTLGDDQDWQAISRSLGKPFEHILPTEQRHQAAFSKGRVLRHGLLCRAIDRWYSQAGPHSLIRHEGTRLYLAPSCSGLPGAMIVQITSAAMRPRLLTQCDGCSKLFQPSRKPAEGRHSFCQACRGAGVPQREAVRRHRARKALAHESS